MKKIIAVLLFVPSLAAASPWTGKLDLALAPAPAAYQSMTNTDMALGFQQHAWSAYRDQVEALRLSLFGGVIKATDALDHNKLVLGPTASVPGSMFDAIAGNSIGGTWLPRLKAGINFGWDFSRPKMLKAQPDFMGVGISYPYGGK